MLWAVWVEPLQRAPSVTFTVLYREMGWHGGNGGQRAARQTTGSFSSCLRHQKLRGKPHPFLDKSRTLNNLLSFLQTNLWYGLLLFFADPPCEHGAQGEEYVPTKHTAAYYASPNSDKSLFCHQAGLLSHPSACPNCQQFYVHEHKRNVRYLRDNTPLSLQMISRRRLPCDNVTLEAVAHQLSVQARTPGEPKGISLKQKVWQNSALHPKFTCKPENCFPNSTAPALRTFWRAIKY